MTVVNYVKENFDTPKPMVLSKYIIARKLHLGNKCIRTLNSPKTITLASRINVSTKSQLTQKVIKNDTSQFEKDAQSPRSTRNSNFKLTSYGTGPYFTSKVKPSHLGQRQPTETSLVFSPRINKQSSKTNPQVSLTSKSQSSPRNRSSLRDFQSYLSKIKS